MKTIYNTYVKMKSQEQCDRMKQLCINNNLPIWDDECAFIYDTQQDFNNFSFDNDGMPEFMVFLCELDFTEITEQEFINLVNKRKKQTTLRNLLTDSRLTIQQFSDRIGVKKSTFEYQLLKCKDNHLDFTKRYKDKFPEVKKVYGTDKDAMLKFLKDN